MNKKTFTFLRLKKEKGFTVRKELIDMLMEQKKIRTSILTALKSGPKTIPEIASETGLRLYTVTWYLMTYWKHRLIEIYDRTDDGFWRYSLVKRR